MTRYIQWRKRAPGNFDVCDVPRPIIAAGALTDEGQGLWFHG